MARYKMRSNILEAVFDLASHEPVYFAKCMARQFGKCYNQLMNRKDNRIDSYIEKLPAWQQKVCKQVRELVHRAEPEITETIKRTDQPYFTFNGNVCALLATKDHVNVFIYDPIASDPENIINQGLDNLTARAVQIYQDDTLNEKAFVNLIKAVVANNRAGGWRKLQEQ